MAVLTHLLKFLHLLNSVLLVDSICILYFFQHVQHFHAISTALRSAHTQSTGPVGEQGEVICLFSARLCGRRFGAYMKGTLFRSVTYVIAQTNNATISIWNHLLRDYESVCLVTCCLIIKVISVHQLDISEFLFIFTKLYCIIMLWRYGYQYRLISVDHYTIQTTADAPPTSPTLHACLVS